MTDFEQKVEGTFIFIQNTTTRKLAEFITHQNEAIEGLTKNNQDFAKSFQELFKKHNPKTPNEISNKAYEFVNNMTEQADGTIDNFTPYWFGWALREAFLAGYNYSKEK